jgi:hypothetical protein
MNNKIFFNWKNINNIDIHILESLNNLYLIKNNFNKEDFKYFKILSNINKLYIRYKKYFYYYFQLYLFIYISSNKLYISSEKFKINKKLESLFSDIKLKALSKNTVLIFNNMNIFNKDKLYLLSYYCINNNNDNDNKKEKIKYDLIVKLYNILSIEIINYIFRFETYLNYVYI